MKAQQTTPRRIVQRSPNGATGPSRINPQFEIRNRLLITPH
jgi:hypothetical protein